MDKSREGIRFTSNLKSKMASICASPPYSFRVPFPLISLRNRWGSGALSTTASGGWGY
jgi:hypothetical protein